MPHQTEVSRILSGLLGAAGSVILIIAGIIMGGELLDGYRLDGIYIIIIISAVILFSVVNSRAADLVLGVGAAIAIIYIIVSKDSVFSSLCVRGSSQLINEYIEKWNYYYETSYLFPDYGQGGVTFFCQTATTLLIIIIHIASGILRRRVVYALYPLMFLAGNFLVGLAPGTGGMMCMLAGVLLALNADAYERHGKGSAYRGYAVTAAMSVFVIIASYTVFDRPADMVIGAHDEFREFQEDIEMKIKFWSKYRSLGSDGIVDNTSPEYTGKEMMKASSITSEQYRKRHADDGPGFAMYLKGYQASDYEDGRWVYDYRKYNEFCEGLGLSEQEVSERVKGIEDESIKQDGMDESVEIEYTGENSRKAYMPYRAYRHFDNEGISLTEDYRFERENSGVRKISIMRDGEPNTSLYGFNYMNTEGYTLYSNYSGSSMGMSFLKDAQFEDKYSQYVQNNYLDVPTSQKSAAGIANEIMDGTGYGGADMPEEVVIFSKNSGQITGSVNNLISMSVAMAIEDGEVFINDAEEVTLDGNAGSYGDVVLNDGTINNYRARMAMEVAFYLWSHASYTLHPGDNGDEDAIEYFLSQGREGFCVHFASAAVMILRSMGIPARYVTGYVAFPRDFIWSESDKCFNASIRDYAAHAWVEIYMENYGWAPYEMTPAYSDGEDKLPTQWTDAETRARRIDYSPYENDENMDNSGAKGQQGTQPSPEAAVAHNGYSGINIIIAATVSAAALAVIIFAAIIIAGKRRINPDLLIKAKISKGKYNRAVKLINHKLYKILRKKEKNRVRKIVNDSAFYDTLQDVYTDISEYEWNRYAGVVRKAVYSDAETERDEALYCMYILERAGGYEKKRKGD